MGMRLNFETGLQILRAVPTNPWDGDTFCKTTSSLECLRGASCRESVVVIVFRNLTKLCYYCTMLHFGRNKFKLKKDYERPFRYFRFDLYEILIGLTSSM